MNAADPAEGPTLSAFGKTGAGLVVGRSLQQIGEARRALDRFRSTRSRRAPDAPA